MDKTIGLLGGGQLGQMLCEAAGQLGIKVVVLDAQNSPAKQVNARNSHVDGSFMDPDKIRELARRCDVLTVEIEHVNVDAIEEIVSGGVDVMVDGKAVKKFVECHPSPQTLRLIKDKLLQKDYLRSFTVAVADYMDVLSTKEHLTEVGRIFKYPYMLKARTGSYDGRGNFPLTKASDIDEALKVLQDRSLYAEKWVDFKMELSVMVVKTGVGVGYEDLTIAYPTVENIHEDSICKLVYAPARGISHALQAEAQSLARKAVACLPGRGIFGVELFVLKDDRLLVNEISPRPHNTGHYTIEACPSLSQFKSHLLAILGLMPPVNAVSMTSSAAIMLNILGGSEPNSHQILIDEAICMPNSAIHMYGKESKPGRKIGHITIIGASMAEAEESVSELIVLADDIRRERKTRVPTVAPPVGITAAKAAHNNLTEQPLVAVTMGSDSDLPVLKPGIALLREFGIPHCVTITSAHRTPSWMTKFAQEAAGSGIKVIIAAAGGAAHLPGMVAANTSLPVIGVPVKGSTLDGMDSLLSIVQMPRGVPVATVSINNSINAALLAARILGANDLEIRAKLDAYAKQMESDVLAKVERLSLDEIGCIVKRPT